MKLKTVQASSFKSLFEVLKDVLNDVNLLFDEKGVTILTLDTARVSLIDLHLAAENFEEYECDTPILAGINISNTFKLFKTISNNDTLEISMTNGEMMNIHINNAEKKTGTKFQLKLLDINEDQIVLPVIEPSIITTMPSIDFQRACRDMNNLASEVMITRKPSKFIISCQGDFANQETTIDIDETVSKDFELSGVYSLKYLNIFTKATGMCSNVQLMQEDDNRFLILKYKVANLGDLNFFLAKKADDI
jgi:proliferating cell nuclear antigen